MATHFRQNIIYKRISDFAIAGVVIGNCRYVDRTDVQLTTSDVFQIKLDSI